MRKEQAMAATDEQILVIPAARLDAVGRFTGFRPFDEATLHALLDPAYLSYRPRRAMETDPSFKQLIPYVVLKSGTQVFHYTRGKAGTEARLRALGSIGIGGHINDVDGAATAAAYEAGMRRELAEEVNVESPANERGLGFIYDPSTPVGEVHLGIVHLFELESPRAWPREDALADAGFVEIAEIRANRGRYETWSQLVLEALKDGRSV